MARSGSSPDRCTSQGRVCSRSPRKPSRTSRSHGRSWRCAAPRRAAPLHEAGLLTFAALVIFELPLFTAVVVLAVVHGLRLAPTAESPVPPAIVVALAPASAAAVLFKADSGGACLVVFALAVALPAARAGGVRRAARDLAVFAGAGSVALVALWLLAGQSLGDLPTWLSGVRSVSAGYPHAMGISRSRSATVWDVGGAALLSAALLVLATRNTPDRRRRGRLLHPSPFRSTSPTGRASCATTQATCASSTPWRSPSPCASSAGGGPARSSR